MTVRRFRRAIVIGCSGAGKSTFARRLGALTGIPVVHLDQLYWQSGWQEVPASEYKRRVSSVVTQDHWIIEGVNIATLDQRLQRADAMFWLTHGRATCLRRVLWRIATTYGRVRPDVAPGCPERLDTEFLRFIWRFHSKYPALIEALIAQYGFANRTVRLASDRETQSLLDEIALHWSHDDLYDSPPGAP